MFRIFFTLFNFFILCFTFISCGLYKKEIVYIGDPSPNPKPIEIAISNVPVGIIYYSPVQPKQNSSDHLFIAKGLGGLGAVLDNFANMLIPFEGLSVNVSSWVPADKIQVEFKANGDPICKKLFRFNAQTSKIQIENPEQINTIVECELDVKVSAINQDNTVTTYTNIFPFVFNLTFKDYAQKNDPLVRALMKRFEISDINQLVSWLGKLENSAKLTINNTDTEFQINHANALTGLVHINALDLSGTSLNSTRALTYLNQLYELNLSSTKVNSGEILKLSQKSFLTKLSLANLNLHDLSFLDDNFKNLTELDLSNNPALFNHLSQVDIQKLSELTSLKELNISNTGLRNFAQLNGLSNLENTLVNLNLSKNDLSALDNSDGKFLKNLVNLDTLNVSESNMSVRFLNDYFQSLKVSGYAKLKTFIYRGRYVKGQASPTYCDTVKDSFLLNINSLNLLQTLETIDFHGQGCVDNTGKEHGLTDTDIFKNVIDLINLDISSTPVASLDGIQELPNLRNVIIISLDGGISITREACAASKIKIQNCAALPEAEKPLPPVEITIENAPSGIVYYSPSSSSITGHFLYTAKGLGGLGAVLDDSINVLNPFEGLKVSVSDWIPTSNIDVHLNANGDAVCNNLFYFNSVLSKIQINNPSQIDTLIECALNIKVTAKDKDGKLTISTRSFPFVFNLTLKEYESRNDPFTKALMAQIGVNDINRMISWLQMPYNSSTIKIVDRDYGLQIRHANALTGLVHLSALDVSDTRFDSARALNYLNQLNELNFTNTNISSSELLNLSQKSNITKLYVGKLNLHDVSFLDHKFKNLVELDLSHNLTLLNYLSASDLQKLSGLTNLQILNISNTGLRNFAQLNGVFKPDTLLELNLSKNDLSMLDNSDNKFLKNFMNLKSLDVSESSMSVAFLNDYFQSLEISGASKLKTFIYRGPYIRNRPNLNPCSALKGSFVFDIGSLTLLPTLETIDLHGQGCTDNVGKEFGLINTNIFKNIKTLVNLDISSTPLKEFNGLQNLPNLKRVIVADPDGGIAMTRSGCSNAKANLIPNVDVYSCTVLSEPNKLNKIFNYSSAAQTFVVPENVWSITFIGCSGANGGAGGGASGSLGYGYNGKVYVAAGSNGGQSGYVNGNPAAFTPGKSVPYLGERLSVGNWSWNIYSAYPSQTGGYGRLGTSSQIRSSNDAVIFNFSSAKENISSPDGKCAGGQNGRGGEPVRSDSKLGGRKPVDPDQFQSGAGSQNIYAPWSTPIEIFENIHVTPGQTLKIIVGQGGAGGNGGTGEYLRLPNGFVLDGTPQGPQGYSTEGYLGNHGYNGTAGTNGFIKIEWDSVSTF